jgi:hypothetical protein
MPLTICTTVSRTGAQMPMPAHHQRIWSEPVADRYRDCLLIASFIDFDLQGWIAATSRVPSLLSQRPN